MYVHMYKNENQFANIFSDCPANFNSATPLYELSKGWLRRTLVEHCSTFLFKNEILADVGAFAVGRGPCGYGERQSVGALWPAE